MHGVFLYRICFNPSSWIGLSCAFQRHGVAVLNCHCILLKSSWWRNYVNNSKWQLREKKNNIFSYAWWRGRWSLLYSSAPSPLNRYLIFRGLQGLLSDNGCQRCHIPSPLPTESRDYDAHARACTNKLQQQSARLGLSGGHGESRGEGAHCVWGPDLALPASDNRITANWTWAGEERWVGGGVHSCLLLHRSIFRTGRVSCCSAALSQIHNFLENHPVELQPPDSDWRREGRRERDGCRSEWRGRGAAQSERREKSKTDQKFREIKLNHRGKEGGKKDGEGKQIKPGQQARGKARHSSTPPLITTHNSERRLKWIKSRR